MHIIARGGIRYVMEEAKYKARKRRDKKKSEAKFSHSWLMSVRCICTMPGNTCEDTKET